jgi:ribonuclease HI
MLIFKQQDIPVLSVVDKANSDRIEYHQHHNKGGIRNSANNQARSNEIKWTPPPATALKTNVDAHCNDDGRWGLGWVVRNVEGVCLGAATSIVCAKSAAEAEARGIEVVLNTMDQIEGFSYVIESDAKEVVKAIQTKKCPRVYWGSIVRNCIDRLASLPNTTVVWGKRDGNKVAHQLARWAFKTPIRGWLTSLPPPLCISYPN